MYEEYNNHIKKMSKLVIFANNAFVKYLRYDFDNTSLKISDGVNLKRKKYDENVYNYTVYQDEVIMFDFMYNTYYDSANWMDYNPGRWESIIEKYYNYISEKINERDFEKQKRMVREYLKNTKRK